MASQEVNSIKTRLKSLGNPTLAQNYKRYLKSPYEFYGLRVPQLRKIAKEISKTRTSNIYEAYNLFDELFNSNNHEEMCLAIFLIQNFKKQYNLETWKFITRPETLNKLKTWDHVDAICGGILGPILAKNPNLNNEIKLFSQSKNPWIRRVSIVSQGSNIKEEKIQMTILLAEKLCHDDDIYVQKATGWMLRECAKKNPLEVQEFIKIHKNMKAHCLSYATEKMLPFRVLIKSMKDKEKLEKKESEKENKEIK